MNFGLVQPSYNLPEWQAVKLTFFAPWWVNLNPVDTTIGLHYT